MSHQSIKFFSQRPFLLGQNNNIAQYYWSQVHFPIVRNYACKDDYCKAMLEPSDVYLKRQNWDLKYQHMWGGQKCMESQTLNFHNDDFQVHSIGSLASHAM